MTYVLMTLKIKCATLVLFALGVCGNMSMKGHASMMLFGEIWEAMEMTTSQYR